MPSSTLRANTARASTWGGPLALYAYEADVVGLLISSIEEFSTYSPGITTSTNRETIGIVTQIDRPDGDPERG